MSAVAAGKTSAETHTAQLVAAAPTLTSEQLDNLRNIMNASVKQAKACRLMDHGT